MVSAAVRRRTISARSASASRWWPPLHSCGSRSGNSNAGAPKNLRSCATRCASASVAVTTRIGRGWRCSSSATASARADPASPATRRQASPSANLFARSANACQFFNIGTLYGTTGATARPASDVSLPTTACEIERQRLQLDREVDVLQADVAWHLQPRGGEVQDCANAGTDELVRHALRRLRRNRQDRDLDAARPHFTGEIAAQHDGHRIDLACHLRGIVVDDGRDSKALPAEASVMEQGRAQISEADQHHRPHAVESEDALQLGLETGDVIADAAHAELAEVRQVLRSEEHTSELQSQFHLVCRLL